MIVIGSMVGGGILGWCIGMWYGFATDHSDFPIYAAFTAPVGAAIGVFIGGGAAALLS